MVAATLIGNLVVGLLLRRSQTLSVSAQVVQETVG
jgi:hypothetical protein